MVDIKPIMETLPIRTQKEYEQVIEQIETLLDSKPNTSKFKLLEVLSIKADNYENIIYPMPKINPIEIIKYELEQKDN